jgi:hypothetical protein
LFITARSEQTSSQAFQETQAHMKWIPLRCFLRTANNRKSDGIKFRL